MSQVPSAGKRVHPKTSDFIDTYFACQISDHAPERLDAASNRWLQFFGFRTDARAQEADGRAGNMKWIASAQKTNTGKTRMLPSGPTDPPVSQLGP